MKLELELEKNKNKKLYLIVSSYYSCDVRVRATLSQLSILVSEPALHFVSINTVFVVTTTLFLSGGGKGAGARETGGRETGE